MFWGEWSRAGCKATPAGDAGGVLADLMKLRGGDYMSRLLFFHRAADVDEVVGDHAEPDPALHSGVALVAAAIEPVSPLDHADASLASGPPFLAVAEPALLLLAFALGALGGAIGNADAFDALRFRRRLILGGVERRRPPPPGAACVRASPDAFRWPGSAGPNRWAADRRLRSRSRSGFRLPAA